MSLIITQNDILFSNITKTGLQTKNRRSNVVYTKKDGSALPARPGTEDIEIAQTTPFINVIDVDWNGAQLKNGSTLKATLNTTGEMLSILQTAYNFATSVADEKYAAKSHQHSQYADRDHNHASYYAPISHASTATKYGVGTDANYGHLKISGAYTTRTSDNGIALSLGAAYNLYTAFVTRISELTAEIATLNSRVATLEGHHTTKPVTAITVTPETYTLYGKGKTAQLSWSITPSDASDKTVTWSSGDTGIATVSAGKITTVAKGRTTITATANGGSNINDTCAVTVNEARITGVNAGNDITATYGGSISRIVPTQTIQQGDGTVFTTGYTYTLTSGSSVTVNDGVLTIVKAGASVITVKSKADPTKSDVVNVTVNEALQPISLSTTSLSWGASDALNPKTITVSGHKGTLSVTSNNTNVEATLSGSTVTVTPKAYNQNATITVKAAAVPDKYIEASTSATVTVAAQATKYYWYAGQINPANYSTITSTVGTPGWRLISNPNTVSQSNPLFDTTTGSANAIVGTSSNYWFIALPADKSYKIYDSDYVDQIALGNFKKQSSTVSFNGVNYNVYKGVGTARKWWGYTIY